MSTPISPSDALALLLPAPRLVVLMCGLAGSGKTTFSQMLEARGFARLSIDETIWDMAGRYGLDYPPEAYDAKVDAARDHLKRELSELLEEGRSVVVDAALWSRRHRDEFAGVIDGHGGRRQIVYLEAGKDLLKARIDARSVRFDANAARPIDDALLDRFIAGFEAPAEDEAALVIAP